VFSVGARFSKHVDLFALCAAKNNVRFFNREVGSPNQLKEKTPIASSVRRKKRGEKKKTPRQCQAETADRRMSITNVVA
jgi:hypothetical protein